MIPTPSARRIGTLALLVCLFSTVTAAAGPYGDALGKCLVSSTSRAEKATLVKWMFVTIALHPDVQSFASVTAPQRTQANKETAQMFERLLTQSCASEMKEALKYEGASTIESSFGLLGQVATRELFAHPTVAAGLEEFSKYFDADKLKTVTEPEK